MRRYAIITFFLTVCVMTMSAFTVVIDAGHGGRDPGALGLVVQEKDLNLEVAKRTGKLIKDNYPDVKVLFTRTTDVFLTLQERADFVNKNHADLFICIHTNAADNRAVNGAETFTLGLNKIESNLDVAMRENAVMLLEDDYQTTYQGFDPKSVESYIMFEFMQDQYIDQSLQFATLVQEQFTGKLRRFDRGVRQAGFWVLHKSACPSVLIEMGFITHKDEERYLASDKGKSDMANAIYNAFVAYKTTLDKKLANAAQLTVKETSDTTTVKTQQSADSPVFCVQIFSVKSPLKAGDPSFKGLTGCHCVKDGNFYKYTYGSSTDYQSVVALRKELSAKFKDCFIVAFCGDRQIPVKKALEMTK